MLIRMPLPFPIRRLVADRRGMAMLEFAIAAPVLILCLLGMIDVAPALMGKFKTIHAAESAADFATSYSQLQTSDMVNAYNSAVQVLAPLPSTALLMRITNVYSDGNGNAKVYWSCGQGALPALTANSKMTTTPTGESVSNYVLTTNTGPTANGTNTSFVMVESQYTYQSAAHYLINVPLLMTNTTYLQPRTAGYIGFPWDGTSANSPTVPTSTTKVKSVTLSNGVVCSYAT